MESNERLYGKKVFIVSREEEENEKCQAIREQAALEVILSDGFPLNSIPLVGKISSEENERAYNIMLSCSDVALIVEGMTDLYWEAKAEKLAGEGKIELIYMFVTRDIEEPITEPLSFDTEDGSMHTVIDVTKLSTMSNPYNKPDIIDIIDKDHFTVKSIKTLKAGETKTEEFKFSRLNGALVTTDSEGVDTILKQNVKQIATGDYHTVVLLEDGTVKAWGSNFNGQLGDGTTVDKSVPTSIPGLSNVKQLAAGFYHTVVLIEDGTVKAWGSNYDGQLGDGT